MKLYFSSGSCGLATQIALREARQKFELVAVDFKSKTTIEGDYYKVSPKGFIPALKLDDGDTITEGVVILQWIADNNPHSELLPAFGTRARYTALEWLNFIATDLHKSFAVLFSPFVDQASKTKFAEGNLTSKFEYLETHLASNNYLMGSTFSAADGYLYNVMCWPGRVGVDISKYGAIREFMARMEKRPTVIASLKAEGLEIVKCMDGVRN
ncbi:glutathione S-transferase [Neorhizobium galegae]|uniref:glutathione transferase GstA n=1 Tax=Neorhizobium galegae TaxID=399 RepID=UPI001AE416EF|nr:glutathione transferase GstA [Neorhizobium galegae]MBP2562562.1 glutathione S-transferase [Neorhizobium galegae]